MVSVPLRLGPLAAQGFRIQRSGVRWLRDDGHMCQSGEVVAYCNLAIVPADGGSSRHRPFATEMRDLQVAFAIPQAGRIKPSPTSSRGGFFDWHPDFLVWDPDFSIGELECDGGQVELELLFLAGRRATEFAEHHGGILSGWHDRTRAWWGNGKSKPGTLLSSGICEQVGIIRGANHAYTEIFQGARGPAQIVYNPDHALVPCARVLMEQLSRSENDNAAIGIDFAQTFASTGVVPQGRGWIFGGTLLSALQRSPLSDHYDVLNRNGLSHAGPPDAVVLSLNAEPTTIMRHKRLGYSIHCYGYRLAETGPAVRAWLERSFEPVNRTLDDMAKDYRALASAIHAKSPMKILILNAMSSSGYEDIQNYAPFDTPLGRTLANIHSKEMNLMLHDLAQELDFSIIDVDAIAAELGGASHLPDGVHSSGQMQDEVRAEILRTLHDLAVPGFAPR